MTTEAVQAWVLHKQWTGNTSARVHFFTRELGFIPCLCKGGRTPKKQSLLQAFTPLWLSLDQRRGFYYAQKIESVAPMFHFTGMSFFSGLYINELLYYILKPASPDSELFSAYLSTLSSLALNGDALSLQALLRRFEWTLLKSCGHAYSFNHEARTGELISSKLCYNFLPGEGFVLADKGLPGEHVLALSNDDLSEEPILRSAKFIMRQAIDYLLGGREIQARYLYSIYKKSL